MHWPARRDRDSAPAAATPALRRAEAAALTVDAQPPAIGDMAAHGHHQARGLLMPKKALKASTPLRPRLRSLLRRQTGRASALHHHAADIAEPCGRGGQRGLQPCPPGTERGLDPVPVRIDQIGQHADGRADGDNGRTIGLASIINPARRKFHPMAMAAPSLKQAAAKG
jgi:hypothetical protein